MKLLVVLTYYPFATQDGGSIFASNSLKYLSKLHVIDLVCFQPETEKPERTQQYHNITFIPRIRPNRVSLFFRYWLNMLRGIPHSVSTFSSSGMKKKVKELFDTIHHDAILLFDLSSVQFCPSYSYGKVILHLEDPHSIKGFRLLTLPVFGIAGRIKMFLISSISRIYENRVIPLMAKVLLLSEADKQDLNDQGSFHNLGCVPYGVQQKDPEKILPEEKREKVIVFSGNMFHLPNIDGALYFLGEIFPLVLKQYSSAIVWIVGADPDERIITAAKQYGSHVIITGRVDDIDSYIHRASVSICPIRLKIGVQTKILEALSWGTPVVTTSAGNSGIQAISGRHLWVEDDPAQFAARVVALLRGNDWKMMSEEGRAFSKNMFSWDKSNEAFERCLESFHSN